MASLTMCLMVRGLQFATLLVLSVQTMVAAKAQEHRPRAEASGIHGKEHISQNDIGLPDVDSVTDYFDSIVFESEYALTGREAVVAKWQRPLRIALRGTVSSLNRRATEQHARVLANISGLDIQILPPMGEGGNLTIHFLTRKELDRFSVDGVAPSMLRRLGAGGCFFLTFQNPPGHIVRGVIAVNVEFRSNEIRHCLLEELTQSLGVPNDSDLMRPSIFSHTDRLLELAPLDVLLLKILYHPSVTPGLTRSEARMRVQTAIKELAGDGTHFVEAVTRQRRASKSPSVTSGAMSETVQ